MTDRHTIELRAGDELGLLELADRFGNVRGVGLGSLRHDSLLGQDGPFRARLLDWDGRVAAEQLLDLEGKEGIARAALAPIGGQQLLLAGAGWETVREFLTDPQWAHVPDLVVLFRVTASREAIGRNPFARSLELDRAVRTDPPSGAFPGFAARIPRAGEWGKVTWSRGIADAAQLPLRLRLDPDHEAWLFIDHEGGITLPVGRHSHDTLSLICVDIGVGTNVTNFIDTPIPAGDGNLTIARQTVLVQALFALERSDFLRAYGRHVGEPTPNSGRLELVLAGYVALRLGDHAKLAAVVGRYTFDGSSSFLVSDAWYLLGECHLQAGDFRGARTKFAEALRTGPPDLSDGLRGLAGRVEQFRIAHPLAPVVLGADMRRAPGQVPTVLFGSPRELLQDASEIRSPTNSGRIEIEVDGGSTQVTDRITVMSPDNHWEVALGSGRQLRVTGRSREPGWVVFGAWDRRGEPLARGFVGLFPTDDRAAGEIDLDQLGPDIGRKDRWWLAVEPAPELAPHAADQVALAQSVLATADPRGRAVLYGLLVRLRSPAGIEPAAAGTTPVPLYPVTPVESSFSGWAAVLQRAAGVDWALRRQLGDLSRQLNIAEPGGEGDEEPFVATALGGRGDLSWLAIPGPRADGLTLTGFGSAQDLVATGILRYTSGSVVVRQDRFPPDGIWYAFALADVSGADPRDVFVVRWEASPADGASPYELLERGHVIAARQRAAALQWSESRRTALQLAAAARMGILIDEAERQLRETEETVPAGLVGTAGRLRVARSIGLLANRLDRASSPPAFVRDQSWRQDLPSPGRAPPRTSPRPPDSVPVRPPSASYHAGTSTGDRRLTPDHKYDCLLVSKFINCLMKDGKKAVASRIFYDAIDKINMRLPHKKSLDVFYDAVENVKPNLEVRSKRVGGANYQVPTPVKNKRQQSLAIRWIIDAAREARGRPMYIRLADELIAASERTGVAMTRRESTHKMAEANKAFAHFAW